MPAKPAVPKGPVVEEALRDLALRRLVFNEFNYSKTSREMGVTRQALHRWWDKLEPDQQDDIKRVASEDIGLAWRSVEDSAVSELIKRIPRMKDHDLVVTAGIAADKAMRYGGVPETTDVTIHESGDIANEIEGILRTVRAREVSKRTEGVTLPA